jgi:polyisoprenoid-binding protein YceI
MEHHWRDNMKKNYLVAACALTVALIGAGCAENPADKVPSANVQTPAITVAASATPASTVEGTVYALAGDSEVGFIGSKVTGSHPGGFKSVKGTVTVPEGNIEQAQVDIKIDTTSIFTDNEKLTGHLKGDDFFAVNTYPESSFKSTSITQDEAGFQVTGDLTLHGETKAISFPASIAVEGEVVKTQAKFSINRKDFGIVYKGKPDDLIRDEVVIEFDLTGNKEA